jgi:hypothetical protein
VDILIESTIAFEHDLSEWACYSVIKEFEVDPPQAYRH